MKTTKKDFELFKKECEKWIARYGLIAWEIDIVHNTKKKSSLADCRYDVVNRTATLVLSEDWGTADVVNDYNVCRSAFHEATELLICNLRCLAETRFLTQIEIDEEVHVIIRTLENVLFNTEYTSTVTNAQTLSRGKQKGGKNAKS